MADLVNVGQNFNGNSILSRAAEVAAVVNCGDSCMVVSGPAVELVQATAANVAAALGGGFAAAGQDADGRTWLVRAGKVTQLESKAGACVLILGPTMVEITSTAAAVAQALGLSVG